MILISPKQKSKNSQIYIYKKKQNYLFLFNLIDFKKNFKYKSKKRIYFSLYSLFFYKFTLTILIYRVRIWYIIKKSIIATMALLAGYILLSDHIIP
jgi:hypothetical protein